MTDFEYSRRHWRFCPLCATPVETRQDEGLDRTYCPACDRFYYDNPITVTMSAVTRGDTEVLLGLRGVEPRAGYWALPGGFMEVGEQPLDAAKRELREETCLAPQGGTPLGVYSQHSPSYGTVVVMGYHFDAPADPPAAGSDCRDARYFPLGNLPELAFDSNVHFVEKTRELLAKRKQG